MTPVKTLRAALLAVLALATALPAAALDLGGHVRDGTVVGLTFGAGWNKLTFATPDSDGDSGTESAFSGGARVGWAKSDNIIYSVGMYGWKRSYAQSYTPISVTELLFLAEVSWFPRGEGFWLRGGVGGGSLDLTIGYLPSGAGPAIAKKGGFTYALGAGYEFRVSEGTAVGIAYDYRYLDIGGFDVGDLDRVESATTTSHNVSLNLHFYL